MTPIDSTLCVLKCHLPECGQDLLWGIVSGFERGYSVWGKGGRGGKENGFQTA